MQDFDFSCTMCGTCCHNLRLPLTIDEAAAWLDRGGRVDLLCEALPWVDEPDAADAPAQHKRRRSFAAASGTLPARVVVILTAAFDGPCPNLGPDMRCGIYEERPLVCGIYPAEINPFVALDPAQKACPPEAWAPSTPPLLRQGAIVDAEVHARILRSRRADEEEAPLKQAVCAALGIDRAALANEGFVIHAPDATALRAALSSARAGHAAPGASGPAWSFVSNQRKTVDTLVSIGAVSEFADAASESQPAAYQYLPFLTASA